MEEASILEREFFKSQLKALVNGTVNEKLRAQAIFEEQTKSFESVFAFLELYAFAQNKGRFMLIEMKE